MKAKKGKKQFKLSFLTYQFLKILKIPELSAEKIFFWKKEIGSEINIWRLNYTFSFEFTLWITIGDS